VTESGKHIFFVTGASDPDVHGFFPRLVDTLQHLALPTISMVIISYAGYHMMQRSLLLDNLGADYVRTAPVARQFANTLCARRSFPVATSVAFSVPGIFTGAVMSERIFAWRGMGQYFLETITKNDVHGAVAVAASVVPSLPR